MNRLSSVSSTSKTVGGSAAFFFTFTPDFELNLTSHCARKLLILLYD